MTSSIRSAATPALGSMIDIAESIRNAITIIIEYVINAVIVPTCIEPLSILPAATHTIPRVMQYMIIDIPGIINVMTRFVKSCVRVSSLFAASKRFSSSFSRPNALITLRPVRISRETRFTLSTRVCMILNFGIAIPTSVKMKIMIAITATAITHSIPDFVLATFTIPPIPMIGAYSTIRSIIAVTIWICCISFVLRVISEAVENLLISAFEKPTTFENVFSLKSLPIPAPTFEAAYPTTTAAISMMAAKPNILPPVFHRYAI